MGLNDERNKIIIEVTDTRKQGPNSTSTVPDPETPTSFDDNITKGFFQDLTLAKAKQGVMKSADGLINAYGSITGDDIGQKNANIVKKGGIYIAEFLINPALFAADAGGDLFGFAVGMFVKRRDDNISRQIQNDVVENYTHVGRNTLI